jgi:hypothetical protein
LADLIAVDTREREYQEYTADLLGAITTRIFKWSGADENFEVPLFSELHQPKKVEKQTAAEIKENILGKLLGDSGKEVA